MDKGGRANTNMSRPDSTFKHTKAPAVRQGLRCFRGNLNIVLTTVRLGVIKIAIVTNHIFLTLIADILKL
jgi:hypothetical protein